jgi:hypothetical protein
LASAQLQAREAQEVQIQATSDIQDKLLDLQQCHDKLRMQFRVTEQELEKSFEFQVNKIVF